MTAIKTPDHPYEQNEHNELDFCKCGQAKKLHLKKLTQLSQEAGLYDEQPFIKKQQELASEMYFPEGGCDFDTLIAQIIQNTGEELLRLAEGERLKVPDAKGTNPHWGRQQAICHNTAIDTLKKHIASVTGVE